MALLMGGGACLLAIAWRRLLPAVSPAPWALVGVCLVVGLADFVLAAVFALQAASRPDIWRPAVVVAVAVSGGVLARMAASPSAWMVLPCAAVVALAARTAETLGRHLAPLLRTSSDYPFGAWVDQAREAQRAVLEVWVVGVGAATVAGLRAGAVPALAAVAVGGLAIAAGARLDWTARLAAEEGYDWHEQDRGQAWLGVGALGALILPLALAAPSVPPLLSGRVVGAPVVWMIHFLFSGAGATPSTPAPPTGPHAGPLLSGALGAVGAAGGLLAVFWEVRQHLLALIPAVLALTLLIAYLRFVFSPHGGDWLQPLRRLWDALAGLFGFWRWVARWWGRREERVAAALQAAGDRGPLRDAAPGRRGGGWLDPRRAVRAAYRRYLATGTATGLPRQDAETPSDYARRLGPELGQAATQAHRLTSAYVEARFSDHRIVRAAVAEAIGAMRAAVAALRRAK